MRRVLDRTQSSKQNGAAKSARTAAVRRGSQAKTQKTKAQLLKEQAEAMLRESAALEASSAKEAELSRCQEVHAVALAKLANHTQVYEVAIRDIGKTENRIGKRVSEIDALRIQIENLNKQLRDKTDLKNQLETKLQTLQEHRSDALSAQREAERVARSAEDALKNAEREAGTVAPVASRASVTQVLRGVASMRFTAPVQTKASTASVQEAKESSLSSQESVKPESREPMLTALNNVRAHSASEVEASSSSSDDSSDSEIEVGLSKDHKTYTNEYGTYDVKHESSNGNITLIARDPKTGKIIDYVIDADGNDLDETRESRPMSTYVPQRDGSSCEL